MTISDFFYLSLLSFVGGIFLASFFYIPFLIISELFILGVFYSLIFFRSKPILCFGICLLTLSLGLGYYQEFNLRFETSSLREYFSKRVNLYGTILKEPKTRDDFQQLVVRVNGISENKGSIHLVKNNSFANVLVNAPLDYEYHYGNKVRVEGLLEKPFVFPDFNYKNYLKGRKIVALVKKAKIKVISRSPQYSLKRILSWVGSLKAKFREVVYHNLSPPQSSIFKAILLGDKSSIGSEWKKKLNVAGVRHITAISGMHIVILTGILMELLVMIGFWRQQAFYFTLAFIWFYIILVGYSPSALRAGVMASLLLFCQRIGREGAMSRILLLALFLMLLFNPFFLRYDVGFQLSFLATLGIIYLYPFFERLFNKLQILKEYKISSILAITFSAQSFTLPILIYNFGYFSLVSPLSNLVITPLLPFIMGSGIAFLFLGLLLPFLGFLFVLPVYFLLYLLTFLVVFFSRIPLASISLKISWIYLPVFYALLGLFVWWLSLKEKENIIKVR